MIDGRKLTVIICWNNAYFVGDVPGWFAAVFENYLLPNGRVVIDSMNRTFPVDADSFGRDDKDNLASTLLKAYPNAKIIDNNVPFMRYVE